MKEQQTQWNQGVEQYFVPNWLKNQVAPRRGAGGTLNRAQYGLQVNDKSSAPLNKIDLSSLIIS